LGDSSYSTTRLSHFECGGRSKFQFTLLVPQTWVSSLAQERIMNNRIMSRKIWIRLAAGVVLALVLGWALFPMSPTVTLRSKNEQIHLGMTKNEVLTIMADVKLPIFTEELPVLEQGLCMQTRMIWDDGRNQYVIIFGTDNKLISASLGESGEGPLLARVMNWFGW